MQDTFEFKTYQPVEGSRTFDFHFLAVQFGKVNLDQQMCAFARIDHGGKFHIGSFFNPQVALQYF